MIFVPYEFHKQISSVLYDIFSQYQIVAKCMVFISIIRNITVREYEDLKTHYIFISRTFKARKVMTT